MNPIIRRELIEVLRTRKALAAQLGLALACALLVLVRFQTAKREEDLAGLLAALVAARLGVTQFREVQTDLEEAFMTVARSDSDGPERGPNGAPGTRYSGRRSS